MCEAVAALTAEDGHAAQTKKANKVVRRVDLATAVIAVLLVIGGRSAANHKANMEVIVLGNVVAATMGEAVAVEMLVVVEMVVVAALEIAQVLGEEVLYVVRLAVVAKVAMQGVMTVEAMQGVMKVEESQQIEDTE